MFALLLIPILGPHDEPVDPPEDTILTDTERLSVFGMSQPWTFFAPATADPLARVQGQRMLLGLYAFDPDPAAPPEYFALSGSLSSGPVLTGTLTTLPVSNRLVVGSTNTVRLKGLKNNDERTYVGEDATVEIVEIRDSTGVAVVGTEGIAMEYVNGIGRNTLYRGVIPHTVPLVAGETYTRVVTAEDVDGNFRTWEDEIVAEPG
jgi:hypothetical protein